MRENIPLITELLQTLGLHKRFRYHYWCLKYIHQSEYIWVHLNINDGNKTHVDPAAGTHPRYAGISPSGWSPACRT